MIVLLPMKRDSERVPKKNRRILAGKPLFFHMADKLKKTNLITNLVINTDCPDIGKLAKERYGEWVIIIKRPRKLCGHEVSMNSIIKHDVNQIGVDNNFLQTHSTNPLLSISTIKNAIEIFLCNQKNRKYDSLFTVTPMKKRLYDKNLKPINHNPKKLVQTQNLEKVFEENSNIYIFSGDSFLKNNHRIGMNPYVYEMEFNNLESLDIDDKNDWTVAEILLNKSIIK